LARELAVTMARTHLLGAHDVVIPQLVARVEFIDELAGVADDAGATFHELLLVDTEAGALDRFRRRRAELAADGTDHPQVEIDPTRDGQVLRDTQEALLRVADQRPATVVVDTRAGAVDEAYTHLVEGVSD
jgi:hypothetical protein